MKTLIRSTVITTTISVATATAELIKVGWIAAPPRRANDQTHRPTLARYNAALESVQIPKKRNLHPTAAGVRDRHSLAIRRMCEELHLSYRDVYGRKYHEDDYAVCHCHVPVVWGHDDTACQSVETHYFHDCPEEADVNIGIDVDYYLTAADLVKGKDWIFFTNLPCHTDYRVVEPTDKGMIKFRMSEDDDLTYTHKVWDWLPRDGHTETIIISAHKGLSSFMYKVNVLYISASEGVAVLHLSRVAAKVNARRTLGAYVRQLCRSNPSSISGLIRNSKDIAMRILSPDVRVLTRYRARYGACELYYRVSGVHSLVFESVHVVLSDGELTKISPRNVETTSTYWLDRANGRLDSSLLHRMLDAGVFKHLTCTQLHGGTLQVAEPKDDGLSNEQAKTIAALDMTAASFARELFILVKESKAKQPAMAARKRARRQALGRRLEGASRAVDAPFALHFIKHVQDVEGPGRISPPKVYETKSHKGLYAKLVGPLLVTRAPVFPALVQQNAKAALVGRIQLPLGAANARLNITTIGRFRNRYRSRLSAILAARPFNPVAPESVDTRIAPLSTPAYIASQKNSVHARLLGLDDSYLYRHTKKDGVDVYELDTSSFKTLDTFIKQESYGKLTDPRVITTLPDTLRIILGRVERALVKRAELRNHRHESVHVKFPNSAYGLNHDEVAEIMSSLWAAGYVPLSFDLSRADGSCVGSLLETVFEAIEEIFLFDEENSRRPDRLTRSDFRKAWTAQVTAGRRMMGHRLVWGKDAPGSVASGSPFTSTFWNICLPEIWDTILAGLDVKILMMSDDLTVWIRHSASVAETTDLVTKGAAEYGFAVEPESDPQWRHVCVPFLGRLWIRMGDGRVTSGADFNRTAPKLPYYWNPLQGASVAECVMHKVMGVLATDQRTPFLSDWADWCLGRYGWSKNLAATEIPADVLYKMQSAGNQREWDDTAIQVYCDFYTIPVSYASWRTKFLELDPQTDQFPTIADISGPSVHDYVCTSEYELLGAALDEAVFTPP